MEQLIMAAGFMYLAYLIFESYSSSKCRKRIKHVIHVNGTRGKSTTCRLIDSALREAGLKVFTKTTGTCPRMIGVDGTETEIRRWGPANIREQLKMLRLAARQGAEVLVLECMAVKPELQGISQQKMLKADIGVITNVRLDHIFEMGRSTDEIARSLSMTIPENGVLFTGEKAYESFFHQIATARNTVLYLPDEPGRGYEEIDFADNVALAVRVCSFLGVGETAAIRGMRKYRKDPGSLRIFELKRDGGYSTVFMNAMAVNDPESTALILRAAIAGGFLEGRKGILLLNTRYDRPDRLLQYVEFLAAYREHFASVWISGTAAGLARRLLKKRLGDSCDIRIIKDAGQLKEISGNAAVFAAGNIGGFGKHAAAYAEKEGALIGGWDHSTWRNCGHNIL